MQTESFITGALGKIFPGRTATAITLHGRSLFALYRADLDDGSTVAVKVMESAEMARTEADGLRVLGEAGARAPQVHGTHVADGKALLCLEFVDGAFKGHRRNELLASLEKLYSGEADFYGWQEDNFIGTLGQKNGSFKSFSEYFWETRLGPQLQMAIGRGALSEEDSSRAHDVFDRCVRDWQLDARPPRLIHGDLWSGNILEGAGGTYLVDPAVSHGNPEQDLAMLELFGSPLPARDLEQLARRFGLGSGFAERIGFWQLYPLLVHVNLFGGHYVHSVRRALSYY